MFSLPWELPSLQTPDTKKMSTMSSWHDMPPLSHIQLHISKTITVFSRIVEKIRRCLLVDFVYALARLLLSLAFGSGAASKISNRYHATLSSPSSLIRLFICLSTPLLPSLLY